MASEGCDQEDVPGGHVEHPLRYAWGCYLAGRSTGDLTMHWHCDRGGCSRFHGINGDQDSL